MLLGFGFITLYQKFGWDMDYMDAEKFGTVSAPDEMASTQTKNQKSISGNQTL